MLNALIPLIQPSVAHGMASGLKISTYQNRMETVGSSSTTLTEVALGVSPLSAVGKFFGEEIRLRILTVHNLKELKVSATKFSTKIRTAVRTSHVLR